MINENDAKTLGIANDKERKLHTYRVIYHLANGEELVYTLDNVPLERNEVMSVMCTDRFMGIYDDSNLNIRGLSNNEFICINMNLVTHVNIKELKND